MRRLLTKKTTSLAILTVILSVAIFQIFKIYQDAQSKLANSRSRQIEQNIVSSEKVRLIPHPQKSLQIIQNTQDTRDLVFYKDSYFTATSGGLLQLSSEGKEIRHFTVLDGLPESDLKSLAVYDAKLFIGTTSKGLISYDGENFEQYRFLEKQIQSVDSLLADSGKLLIGTFNGGLIEFNGKTFHEIKTNDKTIKSVNFLAKIDASLFVGTFDNGLWIYEKDVWKHFGTAEGLPSNRIVGVEKYGENWLVATDFGLSILENEKLRTLKIIPTLSSLTAYQNKIYLSTDNGEIFTFDKQINSLRKIENVDKTRLAVLDGELFTLSNQGIFRNLKPFTNVENSELANNFVSALSFDKNGNLWSGTFRNGIDVFTAEGKKIKHLEDENLREINYLQEQKGKFLAATSKGLWEIEVNFSTKKLSEGAITHFSDNALATSKGLKIGEKLLTNVNGLPSNSTYATLQIGKKLYVGTLGGLAEIEQNKVVKVWNDSNSKLTNNWITAIIYTHERLFVGTYGGGILELLPSGDFYDFSGEIGKFVVNPNAIYSDSERLYVGTLNGVKILNFQNNKWSTLKDILPAEAVFSIIGNEQSLYFATTNGILKVDKNYFDEVEK